MEVYARATERGMAYGSRAAFSITVHVYVLNAFISLASFLSTTHPLSHSRSVSALPKLLLCLTFYACDGILHSILIT